MSRRNQRSLSVIAAEIYTLQRTNVFAIGKLLIEAKKVCGHGDWGDWLKENFEWSQQSAERYMKVTRLARKFHKLLILKLAKTTLYELVDEDHDLLPAIIAALAKVATTTQLNPVAAGEVIELAKLRHKHGNLPDETLRAIDRVYFVCDGEPFVHLDGTLNKACRDAWLALKAEQPTTEEEANKIIKRFCSSPKPPPEPPDDKHESDGETDDDGEPDDESDDEPPQPKPTLEPELLEALQTVVRYARKRVPRTVVGISRADLIEIADFAQALLVAVSDYNRVKAIADRAEARSGREQARLPS